MVESQSSSMPADTLENPQSAVRSKDVPGDSEFLGSLGKRVREIREQILARDADVSERYLAQLEAGDGNISIMLLRRVALALGVSLAELVSDADNSVERKLIRQFLERLPERKLEDTIFRLMRDFGYHEAARKERIALIGLRGAGKSTLGSALAAELHIPFVELDRAIENKAGISLSEVFMLYGQSGYRRIERRCLDKVIRTHERGVIAVGGGVVSEPDTYGLLLSSCFTVWLKAAPEEHMSRVTAQGDFRPMEGIEGNEEAMEDLRRILAAREPLYRKADAVVDTSGLTLESSLVELRQAIRG